MKAPKIALVSVFCAVISSLSLTASAQEKVESLMLAGPSAAVSFPLAYLVASGGLDHLAEQAEFRLWSTPDQLRSLVMGGEADFMAMPSNVVANLYQRGAPVQLVNISTWGILWIISRHGEVTSLADLAGEEIVMPFRGDMPDLVFQMLAEQQGLSSRNDFKLRYVATPVDAMQLVLSRQADHAVLAEPAISMSILRSNTLPASLVAPEISRALSLQDEWGRQFDRAPEMPQAGIAAVGASAQNAALIRDFNAAYDQALTFCQSKPEACAVAIEPLMGGRLSAQAIADSIGVSPLRTVTAMDAQEELTFFYTRLHEREPALVGGQLPSESFYQWPQPQ